MNSFSLSRDEVRELDSRAIHEYGVPGIVLMENAGRGVAELLLNLKPRPHEVCILAGPGNNGGDGFVIARHLQNTFDSVGVIYLGDKPPRGDAGINYAIAERSQLLAIGIDRDSPATVEYLSMMNGWFVDALFGTGLTRALGSPYADIINAINRSKQPILAVDLPSGLDCDTGEPLGPTVKATHTATFVAPKRGFVNPKAKPFLGEVHVIDIGAPKVLVDEYRRRGIV